jgi:hypothetical protein
VQSLPPTPSPLLICKHVVPFYVVTFWMLACGVSSYAVQLLHCIVVCIERVLVVEPRTVEGGSPTSSDVHRSIKRFQGSLGILGRLTLVRQSQLRQCSTAMMSEEFVKVLHQRLLTSLAGDLFLATGNFLGAV